MNWVFMICLVMSMSGALIGMELIAHLHRRILQGLLEGRAVCLVVVAGAAMQEFVSYLAVTAMRLFSAATVWGSAWLSRNYNVRLKS